MAVGDKWDQFEDVLDSVAARKWNNLIRGIAAPARNNARFTTEINNYVQLYAEHECPRDVLIKYIKSDECQKPRKVDPGVHASRIETLCRFANRLQGDEAELTEAQIKIRVFESFPTIWQNHYRRSTRRLTEDTIQQIVQYMNLCKGIADEEEATRGKKRKAADGTERIRGGSNSNKNNNKKTDKKQKTLDHETCPVHGGHTWGRCSLNPRSENYGRYQSGGRGGRFQGRGGGRGSFGGRGFCRGDGGRGFIGGRHYGGRGGNHGRGYGPGRGSYDSSQHYDTNYYYDRRDGQHGTHNDWTQSESHHYHGPPPTNRSGSWQSGRGPNQGPPSRSDRW
ncbi:hypothetical protein SEMRO_1598_G284910.1 [Seminavis robusta]|uniref:Uncharacterized protein n=1 Tax=Seminavis robusta TaxID=568900 RepID=A0A9N8EN47_9STRA|nr:hypothetical protein SEMRO_1598_G284910.1 [Seminavis robusta]|eukprot:Sro1598_g284910.1 n/a (337) ;mRNA; r:6777-7787